MSTSVNPLVSQQAAGDLHCCPNCQRGSHEIPHHGPSSIHDATWFCECACNFRRPKPGFYLRCGQYYINITPGFGCEWASMADPETAKRYETRELAEADKALLESRPRAPKYIVYEVTERKPAGRAQ